MGSEKDIAKIIEVLETIIDPEIGLDVYNLGLIYGIDFPREGVVKIKMTLTTPLCPLAYILPQLIVDEIKKKLGLEVELEIVYDPPWTPDKMTEKGRRIFKEKFGYDIVDLYKSYR